MALLHSMVLRQPWDMLPATKIRVVTAGIECSSERRCDFSEQSGLNETTLAVEDLTYTDFLLETATIITMISGRPLY